MSDTLDMETKAARNLSSILISHVSAIINGHPGIASFDVVQGYKRIHLRVTLNDGFDYVGNLDYTYNRGRDEYRFILPSVFDIRDLLRDVRR